ncbi:MAG: TetR/AcrR family transcriptional regulator [Steroidobacteraceae bacterium]|nr:TetR/AcrR family transcriptional regulator [Steroidobacteraceae bacterium]
MSYIDQRRQEERDRRRAEIVDAAEALYAETGWDAVTMDQVARRARLSRALVYVYFRDKPDLHLALVERALDTLRTRFEAARTGKSRGIDEVEAIGWAYLAFARELPHCFDACARFEARTSSDGLQPNEVACMAAGHRVHETIVASLNRGVADGSIRADIGDPYLTSLALWAFSHGVVQIAATKAGQMAAEGIPVQRFFDQAIVLALRTLQP